jgi:hypothetical protein
MLTFNVVQWASYRMKFHRSAVLSYILLAQMKGMRKLLSEKSNSYKGDKPTVIASTYIKVCSVSVNFLFSAALGVPQKEIQLYCSVN